jgi:type IV pilus assembly protein PilY1
MGVLSKIVTFADKLFANIAGKSGGKITDFVNIDAAVGGVSTYRNSWRQNY